MLEQAPDLPGQVVAQLPADFRFRDPGEVMSYVRHLLAHGILPGDPDLAPTNPPIGYGDSPTGRTFQTHSLDHGVGSGAGSGYTGSDAQTGEGRDGVPYGHHEEGQEQREG
jgi:hypothetical protein